MDAKELSLSLWVWEMLIFPLFTLKWFAAQTQLQPITVLLVQKPEQGDLQKQLLWVPLNPWGFYFRLEVRHTHHETAGSSPLCCEPLRSESPGAMWGFGWLVSALEGSQWDFGTKREVWTWYPHSVAQTATSFTHSAVSSLSLWLRRPCANLFCGPSTPMWPSALEGHIWWAQVSTVWWIQTERSSYTYRLPTISLLSIDKNGNQCSHASKENAR